jgi:steroid delta-isomerase-like uncharacterized protein
LLLLFSPREHSLLGDFFAETLIEFRRQKERVTGKVEYRKSDKKMKRILKVFRKGGGAGEKKTKKSSSSKYQKKLQSPTGTLQPTSTSDGVVAPSSLNDASLYTSSTPQPGEQISSILGVDGNTGNRYTKTTQRIPAPGGGGIAIVHEDKMEDSAERGGDSPPPTAAGQHTSDEQQQDAAATIELTRNLVKKFIADIWNRGEIDMIPEVCSPSLRFNGNTGFDRVGHDGLARMVATIRDALDDYHCEIHSMVVEHNKAFCRLRFTGKHSGHLLGYPPTGKVVAWMGATEFTCQNGKILKVWELGDIKTLEEQLLPAAPAGAGAGQEPPTASGAM